VVAARLPWRCSAGALLVLSSLQFTANMALR
jgi:hypothetical protein